MSFTLRPSNIHTLIAAAVLAISVGAAHASAASAPAPAVKASAAKSTAKPARAPSVLRADPLAGDAWHAMGSTWPGTLTFDGKSKKVVLTPVGAQAIQATYVVSDTATKGNKTTGSLKMTRDTGESVTATFEVIGRSMALRYTAGQRDETYTQMSKAEEEAEKARLVKMLEERRNQAKPR